MVRLEVIWSLRYSFAARKMFMSAGELVSSGWSRGDTAGSGVFVTADTGFEALEETEHS
jgi:hypothetical protein